MRSSDLVVLLTDFGTRDPYVALMKGVLLGIHRRAMLVDLTHEIGPQDVAGAARLLRQAHPFFPDGTIFVCVVDPGVGTKRRIVGVETDRHRFLAPDNGLLGFLQEEGLVRRAVSIENRDFFRSEVSNTFHGRDVIAPAAGHLCSGLDLKHLGPAVRSIATLPAEAAPVRRPDGSVAGRVVRIDRFGNLLTDIPMAMLKPLGPKARVKVGKRDVGPVRKMYGEAKPGEPVAVIDSSGFLEVAVNC